jgi:hypothetical protein
LTNNETANCHFFISLISCSENAKPDKAKKVSATLSIQQADKIDPKVDVFISIKESIIRNK